MSVSANSDMMSKSHHGINKHIGFKNNQSELSVVKKPQEAIYNSMKRKTYSKYDMVKVRVILEDHFYIFSCFLISRILTLIKVTRYSFGA